MSGWVIDASVAVKLVVEEDFSDQATELLMEGPHFAPNHWLAEATNVLWWRTHRGELTRTDARDRLRTLCTAPIVAHPIDGLIERALELSVTHALTVYDTLYVALAERLGLPLVTADRRLVAGLESAPATSQRAIWIGAWRRMEAD